MANISFYSVDDNAPQALELLRENLTCHTIWQWPDIGCAADQLDYAICWQPPADFFDGAGNLKGILSMAAGVDHILNHPGLPKDIPLIRLCDAGMGQKIAEYVHYGVLRSHRSFDQYQIQQQAGNWNPQPDIDAADYRVGIMGFGVIGKVVANHLHSAGYQVSAWKRSPETKAFAYQVMHGDAAAFLQPLNVLVCVLPLTAQTKNIVNAELLSLLPQGAHFINVGRGSQVVEPDLLQALDSGQLSSAVLDVCVEEPLPEEHPFWNHPKVVITPHVAGPTQLHLSVTQITRSITDMEAGQSPKSLPGVVSTNEGY
jgi:glyoxylate/hydroxypyruvate reductase A